MKKYIIFIIILIYSLKLNAQLGAYYQQKVKYNIDVDVNTENYTYKGKQKIKYFNNSPDLLNKFYMHLYWNAFQPKSMMDIRNQILGKDADRRVMTKINEELKSKIDIANKNQIGFHKIIQIKQDGKPVGFKITETILEINLNKNIKPKSSSEFEITWETQIPEMVRRGGKNSSEKIELSMAQWYPKVVEYDYEGWHTFDYIGREFHGVFSNFDVKISINSDYIIAAGGQIQNTKNLKGYDSNYRKNNQKSIYHFKAENVHDFTWAADPDYTIETQQINNGPLVYYVYQKNEKTEKFWQQSQEKIQIFFDVMTKNFGKYPYPTYSFIQGGDGGMEYGQCTLILGQANSLEGLVGLMYHEAAHSWFQHVLATNESTRGWMDEGFTSYAEDLCKSIAFPNSVKNYPHPFYDASQAYIKFVRSSQEEPMILFDDFFNTAKSYTMSRYIKGELFLVNLGYIVGEDKLKEIIKTYYNTWKFKHPTERDFMHIAQNVSKMDLKWYFNYMISTTKTIDYSIEKVESKFNKTEVTLKKIGEFPMPIDLLITHKNGNKSYYTIPLTMMKNSKKTENNITYNVLEPWGWTRPEYSFEIPVSINEISSIQIDSSLRMTDINDSNNKYIN